MKLPITQFIFALSLPVALSVSSIEAASWTGGGPDAEYSTAANWDDGMVPSSGSTQDIDGPFTVTRSVDSFAGRTFVSGGAVLNVTDGDHDDTISDANKWNLLGRGSAGTINQSGGTYRMGLGLRIGVGGSASSDGVYNHTGGELIIYRAGNSNTEPSNPGGRASMEIGDTTGTGLYQISGGSLLTRATLHIAETGTFSVIGSGASAIGIGSQQSVDGGWLQKGLLNIEVDAGGVTPIFVDDTDGGGVGIAEFFSGSLLHLDFAPGVTPYGGTWTILEVEGTEIVDSGLALNAGVDSGWSFDIDNTGANGVLTATYAPTMNGGRVETIFRLEMDGGLDDQFETYSGDSGNPSVPVTVRTDDLGEPPIFGNEPGTMYLDSSNNAHPEADEVMLVQVGPGYTLEQNYIIETWVKPDADKFIFSGNKFNNTFIFSWWEILDWCGLPTAQTDQLNLFMRSDNPTWTRMAGGTYRNIFNQSEEDPTKAIPLDEYSHLAVVWEWDQETSTANFMYYLNGELMVSGSSDAPPYGELPEFFAIGNNSFSATDNEAELACGADINYDGGFSGWYDSFALSTFTGDFEGTADFVLLEQTFPTWAGYEIQDGQHVDTGDWVGWLSVASTPWVYVWNLASWAFVEEVTDDGAWFYITK